MSRSLKLAVLALVSSFVIPVCAVEEGSVWDGVYTDAQARSGEALFDRFCATCHGREPGVVAGHGGTPPIVGEDFRFRWIDASIADLFDTIRQTMPEDAPNSLSGAEYADLTAYLLKQNGYPAGPARLDPAQRDALFDVFIDPSPPDPGAR